MSTRRIGDPPAEPCRHPEHEPPRHQHFEPGTWQHICPGCGESRIFIVPSWTW